MAFIILFAVIGIGIINTVYLSYHCIKKTKVCCIIFPDEWCERVQFSKYSRTFGVPNPYLGFGMLVLIAVLAVLYLMNIAPFWPVFAVVAAGFLFSLYFSFIQGFVIKAYCTWCVLSALVFTALMADCVYILYDLGLLS